MPIENRTSSAGQIVIGHFASGEDAHRAINELIDEGFTAGQIGAAFRSGNPFQKPAQTARPNDVDIRSAVSPGTVGYGSGISGAASDTSAVTPSGLAAGAGTVTTGAGRPGPIPGTEIPDTLPREVPRSIPPEPDRSRGGAAQPATGGFHETRSQNQSWWDKLMHAFGGDSGDERPRASVDETSMNFGTGQGHLGVYPEHDYEYSGSAFESSFLGLGIPKEHSRYLAGQLSRGGAVVTVEAGTRTTEAEEILERNRGQVHYEADVIALTGDPDIPGGRVQVFGQIQGYYRRDPQRAATSVSDATSRKAS